MAWRTPGTMRGIIESAFIGRRTKPEEGPEFAIDLISSGYFRGEWYLKLQRKHEWALVINRFVQEWPQPRVLVKELKWGL